MLKRCGVILLVLVLMGSPVMAMTGQEVIDRVKDEYGDFQSQAVTMVLKTADKNGPINEREVLLLTKKYGEKEKSLLKFLAPTDVQGVGLLDQGDDVMYMYLPEFHKVRRIAGSAKNGSFMGTDFTYRDLSLINYDSSDYESELIDEDNQVYELELIAKDQEESGYEKILMTVRKSDFFPTKLVFYNKEGKLQKELLAFDVTQYGKYKFPKRLEMNDFLSSHRTEVLLNEPEFDLDLKDDLFTTRTLQRSRIRY